MLLKVISLLGLPGSGKSFYGKKLARKLKLKFLTEVATQLIYQQGFKPGIASSSRFDREILEKNIRTAQEVLQGSTLTIWEGAPVQDRIFLEGRMRFVGEKDKRRELLSSYNNEVFEELKDNTLFILFDMDPQLSLQRQKGRMKPELLTSNLKLLKFVRDNLLLFCKDNRERVEIIDVDKPREAVLDALEKVSEKRMKQPNLEGKQPKS